MSTVVQPTADPPIPAAEVRAGALASDWAGGPIVLVLVALCGIGLMLRTQYLSEISFWFDEACSWRISQFPVEELLDAVARDAHPPLFYFLLKGWLAVGGTGAAAARTFGVAFGIGTMLAAWWFVRTAVNLDAGGLPTARADLKREIAPLLAALFVGVSALQIEMSHEARPYTLGTCLALVSGTLLLQVWQSPERWGRWLGFTLSAAALSLTHYYGLFTVGAFYLFLMIETLVSLIRTGWSPRSRGLVMGAFASAWGLQLVWLPWLSTFSFQRARANAQLWMGPLSESEFFATTWKALAGGKVSEVWSEWAWLAAATWGAVCLLLFLRGGAAGRLAALCALMPLIGSVAYSLMVRNILGVRYLMFAQAYLLVATALLLGRGRFPALRWVGVLGVVAWLGFWAAEYSEHRKMLARYPGTRGAVAYLNQVRDPGEPVLIQSPFVHTIALQYVAEPAGMLTNNRGDHRSNILSGPALRETDYRGIDDVLASRPATVWTIDADGLFGGMAAFRMPEPYELASTERFPERFGYRMDLVVREYRLRPDSPIATMAVTQWEQP